MPPVKLDRVHLEIAACDAAERYGRDDNALVSAVLAELASQLRPHVPDAQEGEGLEALLRRLLDDGDPEVCNKCGNARYVP